MVQKEYITNNQAFIRFISNGYTQGRAKAIINEMLTSYGSNKLFKRTDVDELLSQLNSIKLHYKSAFYIQNTFHISKTTFYRLLKYAENVDFKVKTYGMPIFPQTRYNFSQFSKIIKMAAQEKQKAMDKINGISNLEEIECNGIDGRAIISDDHQLLLWSVASKPKKIELGNASVKHIRKSYPGQMLSRFSRIDLVQHFSLLNEGGTKFLAPDDVDWLDCVDLLLDFAPNNMYDINFKKQLNTFDVHIHSGSFWFHII